MQKDDTKTVDSHLRGAGQQVAHRIARQKEAQRLHEPPLPIAFAHKKNGSALSLRKESDTRMGSFFYFFPAS